MVIAWKAKGEPHYVSQDSNLPYISDIGADFLKPLFITGGTITAIAFFLSLVIERWLRHSGRYAHNSILCGISSTNLFNANCALLLV